MTHKQLYEELIFKIKKYHPSNDFTMIEKAYFLAIEAHGEQLRKSGEPYIIHPLSVAIILAELELDFETIISGLLHDVIEDTKFSYDDIAKIFNNEVAYLVDGVTKLEQIKYHSKEEIQAENYRKMFLAMAKDIRVILIKIADRLHNMRTLKYMNPQKQKEKAQETLDIYAPLANRLGISKIRYDLEDISFRYLDSDAYFNLAERIQLKQSERQAYVSKICQEIRQKLMNNYIDCEVHGRPKHFFSIYKKMLNQNKTLDQIYDLFAVRVMVGTIRDCYEVLGIVHEMYKPIPGRFKDYIAMAKSNMYQSLHNTLIGIEGEPFEIQIRTWEMHRTAEYGIAAHWKYKQKQNGETSLEHEEEKLTWLRQILEWQREYDDNKEYLQALKCDLNVFDDYVYCFTPKGDVISLINGANPIDFAYTIHTAIGNKTIGARVNGKIVTIDYTLKNGDRIEIITSKITKGPSRDWIKMVKTNQARSKINQWFKKQNKDENIILGKELIEKEAKRRNLILSELTTTEAIKIVLNKYAFVDWDSLCASVACGAIKEAQVINKLKEIYLKEHNKKEDFKNSIENLQTKISNKVYKKNDIFVKGLGSMAGVRFSRCCSPVPGDDIIGFITRGRGLSIHRKDCHNIVSLDQQEKHRLTDVSWQLKNKDIDAKYRADLVIICFEKSNLLSKITKSLDNENIKVSSLNAKTVKDELIFNISIMIDNKDNLNKIINKLMLIQGIISVRRVSIS